MITSIEGDEATGKTTLAYTAPLPIVGFAFDMGAERAIFGGRFTEFFKGLKIEIVPYQRGAEPKAIWQDNDITVYELPQPVQLDSIRVKGCKELWSYFIVLVAEAFTDAYVRSIVIDTMTVARRVKADAYLQALQDSAKPGEKIRERLLQIEYGNPNDATRNLYTTGAGVKKNLIATHHLTDEYGMRVNKDGILESQPTGKRILEGLNHTYRFVDVAVRMDKEGGHTKATLRKCGYNLVLEGTNKQDICWDSLIDWISIGTNGRLNLERRKNEV